MFRKYTWRNRLTLLCLNVIKSIRPEIGGIVRYLPDKKETQFQLPLKLSLLRGLRSNLPEPAPNNVLTVF